MLWINISDSSEHWIIQNFKAQGEWAFGGPIYSSKVLKKIFDALLPISFWSVPPLASLFIALKLFINPLKEKKITLQQKKLGLLVVLAVASWAQYFPVPCNRHYFWAGTPMFIPFFVYLKNLYYYLKETPFSLNKTSFIFALILLSSILSSTIFEVLDRSLSAVAKINKYQYEIKEPHVLKGVLVESQDTVVQLETINSWLQKIRQRHPDISLIGKDIYNQLFATFLPRNELPGILPSAVFTYGPLEATYKFFKHEKNFILEKRPIIYSGKELKLVNELSDYRLLFRVKFKHALEYQSGHALFYVHKDLKLD